MIGWMALDRKPAWHWTRSQDGTGQAPSISRVSSTAKKNTIAREIVAMVCSSLTPQ